jgi:hypothetical protein
LARKPPNFEWLGFTKEQVELLDLLDLVGNNGWSRNGQSETLMPRLLTECADAGLSPDRIIQAMEMIGYHKHTLHILERWESKCGSGTFGK